MIKILTLMDNLASENSNMRSHHGLSFHVETGGRTFLFDCGPDDDTIYNAHRLGVDLKHIDFTICSHSHYDHASGYRDIVENGFGGKTLYTGPGFWQRKYGWDGLKYTDISAGFDDIFLRQHDIEHKVCEGLLEIADDCWLVSDFPRVNEFEAISPRFVKGNPPDTVQDDFSDEVCLAAKTQKGLVVLVGCSHPGILNMITRVHDVLDAPIYAVFGGTHLMHADEERISLTIDNLCKMGLSVIGLSHCSGERAEKMLAADKRVRACHLASGNCIAIR